jgi:O-antigen/teichoic acid export membrane protein
MQKKFLTNIILLLFLNLLVKPFWILGIDRAVQNTVGAADYGFYFSIFNLTFLFNILLDFGITNFNNRNIAQNNQLLNKHFSSILILKFLLGVFYFLITFIIAGLIKYDARQLMMLGVLCFNQFLISFILYLRSNVSGLHFFRTDSVLSVLDRFLMIGICSVLLWGKVFDTPFRIEWFVFAQTGSYLITAAVALFIVVRKASFNRLKWNLPFFIVIVRQSFPFAILVLLMAFYNRIDSVMLERMLSGRQGEFQAGLYASAYRLLDAANMIAFLFSVILLPMFSRMIKFKQNITQLARLSFTLLFLLSTTVVVISVFYRHGIMNALYPQHISETAADFASRIEQTTAVFGLLMGGFIAISTTYVFGTLLTANGNLKQLNIMAACGMLLNIGLNLYLIPRMLATGSAYASLVTQFITATIQVILVVRIFRFKTDVRYLMRLLVFLVILIVTGVLISGRVNGWFTGALLIGSVSLFTAAVVRLLPFRQLIGILRGTEEEDGSQKQIRPPL